MLKGAWILISMIILLILLFIIFLVNKKKKKPEKFSRLTLLAFIFVLAGIIFGESRLIGYSLMGIGVLFAIIDVVIKSKKK